MASIAREDLEWVSASDLKQKIQEKETKVGIIDVRGGDFVGGHIPGCYNYSSQTFTEKLPELYEELEKDGVEEVIFHCRSSNGRGVRATLEFLNTIDTLPSQQKELFDSKKVKVLTGGFLQWQKQFGNDTHLTEDYDEELWKKVEQEIEDEKKQKETAASSASATAPQ